MAEEANEAKEGEEQNKGGGLKAILIPVIASAVTSAIVGFLMIMFLAPKPAELGDEAEGAAVEEGEHGGGHGAAADTGGHGKEKSGGHGGGEAKPTGAGIFHQYDPFIVTVFDHEKVHYLKATVALELKSEGVKDELLAKDPQIRDSLIFVLGDFTLRELLDNQAKLLVKDVLIKTLNKIVGKDKIINVYFTEFTIQ